MKESCYVLWDSEPGCPDINQDSISSKVYVLCWSVFLILILILLRLSLLIHLCTGSEDYKSNMIINTLI